MIQFICMSLVILALVPAILSSYPIIQPFTLTEFMKLDKFMKQSYNSIPTETFDSAQDGADEYRKISSSLEKYSETMSDLMEKGVEPTELCEVMMPDLDAYGGELPKIRKARAFGDSWKEFHDVCENTIFLTLECDRAALSRGSTLGSVAAGEAETEEK